VERTGIRGQGSGSGTKSLRRDCFSLPLPLRADGWADRIGCGGICGWITRSSMLAVSRCPGRAVHPLFAAEQETGFTAFILIR